MEESRDAEGHALAAAFAASTGSACTKRVYRRMRVRAYAAAVVAVVQEGGDKMEFAARMRPGEARGAHLPAHHAGPVASHSRVKTGSFPFPPPISQACFSVPEPKCLLLFKAPPTDRPAAAGGTLAPSQREGWEPVSLMFLLCPLTKQYLMHIRRASRDPETRPMNGRSSFCSRCMYLFVPSLVLQGQTRGGTAHQHRESKESRKMNDQQLLRPRPTMHG